MAKRPLESNNIISSLIENSTRIKGRTLTNHEVQKMLENGIEPNKPENEKLMVKDYSDGLLLIMKLFQNKIPLSISILETLNYHVMKRNGELKKINS